MADVGTAESAVVEVGCGGVREGSNPDLSASLCGSEVLVDLTSYVWCVVHVESSCWCVCEASSGVMLRVCVILLLCVRRIGLRLCRRR